MPQMSSRLIRQKQNKTNVAKYFKLGIFVAFIVYFIYWSVSKSDAGGSEGDTIVATTHTTPEKNSVKTAPLLRINEAQEVRQDKVQQEVKNTLGKLPDRPLRSENYDIVSRSHPIDLTFVDVSTPDHPHRGALDEDGNFGYIFDELYLRKKKPEFQVVDEGGNACVKNNDGNYKMLTEKVKIDLAAHDAAEAKTGGKEGSPKRAKIMCIVYTIEENHSRIPPIQQTWGQRCDGFIVISDKTDPIIGTVNVPHEGPEEYKNIWQKIRSTWSYIYDNYYELYDWFHIGGDDLYILVENLRLYLESEEIQLAANGGKFLPDSSQKSQYPLFLGRRFKEGGDEKRIFNSGGSGYTLNKAALKALVVFGFPTCMPHMKTFAEDVMVAQCLRNKVNVYPYDTKDNDGSERYMPFQPSHHLNYKIPTGPTNDWYAKYSINIKEGLDHCSVHSVAFHYIKPTLMKRMHAILYGLCSP